VADLTAYPLAWPPGRPRTAPERREWSRFHGTFQRRETIGATTRIYKEKARLTLTEARVQLFAELERLGARRVVVSTNIQLRRDGLPYADSRQIVSDPGVAVYFELGGEKTAIACDRWRAVAENMRAIAKTVEAIRGIERWGSGEMVRAAFRGFRALPPASRPWREVLGLPIRDLTEEEITTAFRERAKAVHPDVGGQHDAMAELNAARVAGLQEIGH
jgi:hypothetical protein